MQWAKHYVGMVTDDKFAAAAEIAAVGPLLPPVLFSALFERAAENGDGSITGFQPRVFAVKFKVSVEEVGRTLAAFAELALVAGDRLANWVKRQGAAAAETVRTVTQKITGVTRVTGRRSSAPRMRKLREKQRQASRQGELLLPLPGGGVTPVTDDVTPVTPVTGDTEEREGAKPPEKESESDFSSLRGQKTANDFSKRGCAAPTAAAAADQADKRAKRINMVRSVRDWCTWSPHATAADTDSDTLQMLLKAEAAAPDLAAWNTRLPADKAWFERLHARAKANPLDHQAKEMLRAARRPGGDPGLQQIMARAGWLRRSKAA